MEDCLRPHRALIEPGQPAKLVGSSNDIQESIPGSGKPSRRPKPSSFQPPARPVDLGVRAAPSNAQEPRASGFESSLKGWPSARVLTEQTRASGAYPSRLIRGPGRPAAQGIRHLGGACTAGENVIGSPAPGNPSASTDEPASRPRGKWCRRCRPRNGRVTLSTMRIQGSTRCDNRNRLGAAAALTERPRAGSPCLGEPTYLVSVTGGQLHALHPPRRTPHWAWFSS